MYKKTKIDNKKLLIIKSFNIKQGETSTKKRGLLGVEKNEKT